MSRTWGGQSFICKECGETHLIPYNCKPNHNFKTIEVPCLHHPDRYHWYRGYEFESWVGLRWYYVDYRVKPRGFEDSNPNFEE